MFGSVTTKIIDLGPNFVLTRHSFCALVRSKDCFCESQPSPREFISDFKSNLSIFSSKILAYQIIIQSHSLVDSVDFDLSGLLVSSLAPSVTS